MDKYSFPNGKRLVRDTLKPDDNLHYEKYGEPLPDGWAVTNFGTLLSYEQPTKYIVNNTNYKPTYETPVLTAGKSFILGYTDETDNIFDDLPVIIFDDFTTESKYVDFAFKVKSSAMKILHINQELVLPKYAFFLMQATEIDHDNHQRYWISTYSQEIISLPPLSEQIKIIEAIDYLFELVQSVDNNIHNLKSAIKSVKSKILDLAISGKLVPQDPNDEPASVLLERIREEKEELIKQGKIKRDKKESVIFKGDDNSYYEDLPCQWVETKLSTISEVITKGTTPRGGKVAYADNGIGFLRAENIAGYEKLALNNLNYVDEKSHNDFLKRSILKANDILITIAGTLGRTAVVPCEALPLNTNQAVAIVRLVNCKLVNVRFIIFAINSPTIKKDLLMQSVDMAIPNLSLENISNCTIPLPPLAEQRRIVNTIEALFAQIDKIAEQIS